jgi:hypothetical protein
VGIRRKSIMFIFNSLVTINATSLFFHNRRFETPATKKDFTNEIHAWTRRLQAPPLPASRRSKATLSASTASKANLTLVKNTTGTTTTEPTSCAVVFKSTTDVLQKNQAQGTKRQFNELGHYGDTDNDMEGALYGGLDEDEDDEMEAAEAALSPLKPAAAAQMSKVSPLRVFEFMITPLLIRTQYCSRVSLYSAGTQFPRGMQGDKVIVNSPLAHSTVGGGRLYLSQRFSNMSVA